MTGRGFMRYLEHITHAAHPAMCDGDPRVEMYDGIVRVFDQRGESMRMRQPFARQLLALAFQLEQCAAELERRGFDGDGGDE